MDPEQWARIETLFHQLHGLPQAEREAFLEREASSEVRREVESMLAQDASNEESFQQAFLRAAGDALRKDGGKTLVGRSIGPYQVLSFVAAGGMGEVYRARHLKLERDVALKVLPEQVSQDPERLHRSEREAKLLASLNHTNIAAIYDLVESDGIQCLVLEYVEGQTLAQRLKRGRLPIPEALEVARQIAEALEAAHERGIIHRDLKPGNVMMTADGTVKVLDFGIARILESGTPVDTALTAESMSGGVILGTPGYMSPEQVKGQRANRTSDIWAFGCVLYEILTGCRTFDGDSAAEILGRVSESEPDWTTLPTETPSGIRRLVERCLRKDSRWRLQNIGDARIEIEEARSERHAGDLALDLRRSLRTPTHAVPEPQLVRTGILPWVAAAVFALAFAAAWGIGRRTLEESSLRVEASLINLAGYTGTERSGAISPDGKLFAFVSERTGQPDIWVRQVSGGDPVQITHDGAAELDLVYAPDGESIYYSTAAAPRTIWRVGVLGGSSRKIVEDARYPAPSPDGKRLAFVRSGEILEVANTDGSGPHQIASISGIQYLQWSPDGRSLAYTAGGLFDTYQIHIIDPDGKNQKQLTSFRGGTIYCVAWMPGGRDIIFAQNPQSTPDSADLFSVSLDTGELRRRSLNPKGSFGSCSVSADGKRLLGTIEEIDFEIWMAPLGGDSVSNGKGAVRLLDRGWEPLWADVPRAGMLLFNSPATGTRNLWIMPVTDANASRQVTFLPTARITHAALSVDGSRIGYVLTESGSGQIWVANSDGSGARQLTNDAGTHFWPFWSPDGQWVAFASMRPGPAEIWKIPSSGGTPVQLTHSNAFRGDWSPDGRRIVYDTQVLQGGPRERENQITLTRIEIADASAGTVLRKVAAPSLGSPIWSPDGKHISATSGNSVWIINPETGERHVAIQFPQDFILIFRAAWTPDGKSVIVNRQQRVSHIVLMENF